MRLDLVSAWYCIETGWEVEVGSEKGGMRSGMRATWGDA